MAFLSHEMNCTEEEKMEHLGDLAQCLESAWNWEGSLLSRLINNRKDFALCCTGWRKRVMIPCPLAHYFFPKEVIKWITHTHTHALTLTHAHTLTLTRTRTHTPLKPLSCHTLRVWTRVQEKHLHLSLQQKSHKAQDPRVLERIPLSTQSRRPCN